MQISMQIKKSTLYNRNIKNIGVDAVYELRAMSSMYKGTQLGILELYDLLDYLYVYICILHIIKQIKYNSKYYK